MGFIPGVGSMELVIIALVGLMLIRRSLLAVL